MDRTSSCGFDVLSLWLRATASRAAASQPQTWAVALAAAAVSRRLIQHGG